MLEYRKPPDEYRVPPEYGCAGEYINDPEREYTPGQASAQVIPKRHKWIKWLMFGPIATVVATLSLVLSALGLDPLGSDFLTTGNLSGPSVNTTLPALPPAEGGDPVGTVTVYAHVTYVPTGETYTSPSTDTAALSDVLSWVITKGGDGGTITYQKSTVVRTGYELSDDAIVIGDLDNLDSIYLAQGTITFFYRRDVYYLAYPIGTAPPSSGKTGDAFPALGNLNPDFAGDYAWSGSGSEEYVRFRAASSDAYSYLEMGSVWASMGTTDENGNFVPNTTVTPSNAVYDSTTNTLTLTNFSAYELDVNLMGNGFKIELAGDNQLDRLCIWGAYYGGSVTLTGSGTLTVNKDGRSEDGVGIRLQGEFSQSCLMIDKGVTLDVYGEPAILIGATTMEKSVYYLPPLEMTGGEVKNGDFAQYGMPIVDDDGNYIGSENLTISEISERDGNAYYDSSVVDTDGKPSTHVRFAPASE